MTCPMRLPTSCHEVLRTVDIALVGRHHSQEAAEAHCHLLNGVWQPMNLRNRNA
jgi:hypothetical protein